jgi:hypothetical protein
MPQATPGPHPPCRGGPRLSSVDNQNRPRLEVASTGQTECMGRFDRSKQGKSSIGHLDAVIMKGSWR